MKLRELVVQGQLIEVCCDECRARTLLDPAFFLARRGDIALRKLNEDLVCGACGSADVDLKPYSAAPVRQDA